MQEQTTTFSQGVLWMGAAISIAEISTGALLAPLGLVKGLCATVLGHLIGFAVLYLAGVIGARSKLSSTQSTAISFGRYGSFFFSSLNVLQLLGWTAVMIISGAAAIQAVTLQTFGFGNFPLWCGVIGGMIALWILAGIKNVSKVNVIAVTALFILCVVLGIKTFSSGVVSNESFAPLSFGAAVELSVAMPLSWLPLIADYTRTCKNEKAGNLCASLCYTLGGVFMYAIGLSAAVFAGTSNISAVLMKAGLGVAALVIVLLSTVTTTFLDAFSAGVSCATLSKKVNEKYAALIVCAVGTVMAVTVSMAQYESFLYLIGSVFAPLFAILFTDYFLFGRTENDPNLALDTKNALLWIVGFVFYRFMMRIDFPLGNTLPVMLCIVGLCVLVRWGERQWAKQA